MDIQDFIANDGLLTLKADPNKWKSWLWFPHVQNLTEPIKRVLQQVGVGLAMKPVCVLSNIFCKPKDKVLDKE